MTRVTIQPVFKYSLLFKSFLLKNNHKHNLFMSGRYAFEYALKILLKNNENINKILVPTLICEEIITIIKQINIDIEFYDIDKSLKIDLLDIENKMKNSFSIILVVNYFGFPSQWKELYDLRKNNKCILIEDNTHTLYSKFDNKELGMFGDISFNSLRKILPLLSGSELRSNTDMIKFTSSNKHRFPSLSELIYSVRNLRRLRSKNLLEQKMISSKYVASKPVDYLSKKIITHYNFDYDKIRKARISNYKFWSQYLRKSDLIFFDQFKINNSICPYVFPCYAETDEIKLKWLKWGRDKNITIISWPKFHDSTKSFLNEQIMKRIICFPVNHQFDLKEIIG